MRSDFPEATGCLEMKTRHTEMRNECAKFLLSAYRPNGADALDPVFKDALEQLECDPQVKPPQLAKPSRKDLESPLKDFCGLERLE